MKDKRKMFKKYPNPYPEVDYIIKSTCLEVTFIGMKGDNGKKQSDFAEVTVEMIPDETIIDLKSLKFYFAEFRDELTSYERLINVIFDDIDNVFTPKHLTVSMKTNLRGGIYSELIRSSG